MSKVYNGHAKIRVTPKNLKEIERVRRLLTIKSSRDAVANAALELGIPEMVKEKTVFGLSAVESKLRTALETILDQVDYTGKHGCPATSMVGAVLQREVIAFARDALATKPIGGK